MFKITNLDKANGHYSEEHQPNPLRWLILNRVGPEEFTAQGHWLKCKDFFNDYVYSYNTRKGISIYSFNAGVMDIPPKGEPVFMALKAFTPHFQHNMKVMNEWLQRQQMPPIPLDVQDNLALIVFDPIYLKNTYNISLISLMIRLMSDPVKFDTFEEALKYKGFYAKDQQKWDQVVKKGIFFKIPSKFDKYLWYYQENSNSEKIDHSYYGLSGLVHNCGVLSWQASL